MRLPQLTACPVCHGTLTTRVQACPKCESDLSPYYEQHSAACRLINTAANAVSRGELTEARQALGEAERLLPAPVETIDVLRAVIALRENRLDDAQRMASALAEDCPEKAGLMEDIAASVERMESAKMHFNLALTSARQGSLADAAHHADKALSLAPHLAEAWRLAVQIALKREEFDAAERYLLRGAELLPDDSYLTPLARAIKIAKR
jgi:tetratricopeptide (TPR) repeat protein